MASRSIRLYLTVSLIMLLFSTFIPCGGVRALTGDSNTASLPGLEEFVEQVKNGRAEELRGVYIPEVLAARIVQQPAGMGDFVSPWQNVLTQFGMASRVGSTGLLAHNYHAGSQFARLQKGQEVHLVHGDGRRTIFIVSEVLRYRALDPVSTSGTFVNLEDDSLLTYSELFTRVYQRPGQVVFQTCIQAGDDPFWGRLFVIAEPVP